LYCEEVALVNFLLNEYDDDHVQSKDSKYKLSSL